MIAKAIEPPKGRRGSFSKCINYILGRGEEPLPDKVVRTWSRGVMDIETAAAEMAARAAHNRRAYDVVVHLLISYEPGEQPTEEQELADIEGLLDALDMADHQFVAASHRNTKIRHNHIVACKVGPDGKCAKSSHSKVKRERFCATTALQRGWKVVDGHFNADLVRLQGREYQAPRRQLPDGEFKREQQAGEPPWSDLVRSLILPAVERGKTWDEFRSLLSAHGIVIVPSKKHKGFVFRAGYAEESSHCSASQIDMACRYKALVDRFGPWVEPQARIEPVAAQPIEEKVEQMARVSPELSWLTDNLALRSRYGIYRDAQRASCAASRAALSSAWGVEKELRQLCTSRRRAAHQSHRQAAYKDFKRGPARDMALYSIDFMINWNRRFDAERAKRRWAEKKLELSTTHPVPKPLTFRQFVEHEADKGGRGGATPSRLAGDAAQP